MPSFVLLMRLITASQTPLDVTRQIRKAIKMLEKPIEIYEMKFDIGLPSNAILKLDMYNNIFIPVML